MPECIQAAVHPRILQPLLVFRSQLSQYYGFIDKASEKEEAEDLLELEDHKLLAFDKLTQTVSSKLVLAHPRPDAPSVAEKDDGDYQVGVALFHIHPDADRKPTGFWTPLLNSYQKNCSVTERRVLGHRMDYSNPLALHSMSTFYRTLRSSVVTMASDSLRAEWLSYALANTSR